MTPAANNQTEHSNFRIRWWLWLLLVVLFAWMANPFQLYFLNDDFIYVQKAPGLSYLYRTAFRPVSDLTLLLDHTLYHKNAWGYHLTNLVFHLLASLLVYKLAARFQQHFFSEENKGEWVPQTAALLFLLYPFHSESIFWIVGRGGSLITIQFAAAMIAIMPHTQRRGKHWLVAVLFFVAGLFTYESSWLMPLACSMVVFAQWKRGGTLSTIDKVAMALLWLILVISFVVRKRYIGDFIGSPYLNTDHFGYDPIHLAYNYTTGFFRSFLPPMESGTTFIIMAAFVGIALTVILFRLIQLKHLNAGFLLLAGLFVVTLTPICLLGVNTHTSESERFLYLPSMFLCIGIAFFAGNFFRKTVNYIFIISISALCLVFLYQSSAGYRTASDYAQKSMKAFSSLRGNYQRLEVYNLPSQYKGGLIFRLGFEDGLQWMAPAANFDSIIIHSTTPVNNSNPLQVYIDPAINAASKGSNNSTGNNDIIAAWRNDSLVLFAKNQAK